MTVMSAVLGYARDRMKGLGYNEWTQGFAFENIPKTALNKTFHLEAGIAVGKSNNQRLQITEMPFTVRVFRSSLRDSQALRDQAIQAADTVCKNFLAPKNRLTQEHVKNITFDTMDVESISKSNDNGVIVKIEFTALVMFSTS